MTLPGETIATGAPTRCPDCDVRVKLQVCHSNAGYYVGTMCDCGPYSRESDYYKKHEDAAASLNSGEFGRP